jgi:hypothetical protein
LQSGNVKTAESTIPKAGIMERKLTFTLAIARGLSLLALIGALVVTGCATADPPLISKDGCTVDLRKVCQYLLDNNRIVSSGDGVTLDKQRMQNMSVRHVEVTMRSYGGAQLRCVVDSQTARATDGHISDGPQLNDADAAWARSKELCQ